MTRTSWLSFRRAVIWDLDGTLYEETRHFDYYADQLATALPPDRRDAFYRDYQAARAGRHRLRVGTLYDRERDCILALGDGRVRAVWNWQGESLPESEWQTLYGEPPAVDHRRIYNVGDLWWVPAACAVHHGLASAEVRRAFLATRDHMSRADFALAPIPGLREAIALLRRSGRIQVLATNSPEPDSRSLLAKLGLADSFDLFFFETRKPTGLQRVLAALQEEHGIAPPQVLSIGDNYLNDLLPIRRLGGSTALIDSHDVGQEWPCDIRVRQVAELIPHLTACA